MTSLWQRQVCGSVNKSSEAICKVINDLTALPLPLQGQFIVLRMSAQMRLARLQRVTQWRLVKEATLGLEDKSSQVGFKIMRDSKGQLILALRFRGMGLDQ